MAKKVTKQTEKTTIDINLATQAGETESTTIQVPAAAQEEQKSTPAPDLTVYIRPNKICTKIF